MKILFTGTGAADWNIKARTDGAEFRRFSSAMIDGDLIVDPGPHIYDFAEKQKGDADGRMFDGAENIIITHSHMDHFSCKTVEKLCAVRHRTIVGDSGVYRKLLREYATEEAGNYTFITASHGKKITLGEYEIMPLYSNHATSDPDEITYNYAITKNGKNLFYGLDGAWLIYKSWVIMRDNYKFDGMIMEATLGDVEGDDRIFSHTSLPMLEIMLRTIRRQGVIIDGGKIVISHMARTLHTPHGELEARVKPLGIVPAYDGYEFEI